MVAPKVPLTPRQTADASLTRKNKKRAKEFEASNPERFQGIEQHRFGNESPADTYKRMDIGVAHHPLETSLGQQHLPGMEHPGTVGTPPRWHELEPQQQHRVLKAAAKFGVTPDSAHRALAASVDHGAMAEGRHRSFYSEEGTHPNGDLTPRQRLKDSAADNGVPFHVQAAANAITSPKQQFSRMAKSGPFDGQRIYPNDMHASAAIKHVQAGGDPETAKAAPGVGGMNGPSVRAAKVVKEVQGGKTVAEAWKAGDKTGPYHNSWVEPHGPSQYWVSDIHSGGGAIAPHLSVTEREKYLTIKGIHSFHDHVAHNVAQERGIQSLTGMQSMQWNAERSRRGKENARYGESHESFMGSHTHDRSPVIHGQMDIFGGTHNAPTKAPPRRPGLEF